MYKVFLNKHKLKPIDDRLIIISTITDDKNKFSSFFQTAMELFRWNFFSIFFYLLNNYEYKTGLYTAASITS